MRIIGITGKARSGKDTAAEYITGISSDVKQYAFATPLKEACAIMFGIDIDNFYNPHLKEKINLKWGISPREMAQKFGTECARNVFFDDFWIRRANISIIEAEKELRCNTWIVTDVRYENEAEWIRNMGGEIWHIERPSINKGVVRDHISELGIDKKEGDIIIVNDSTIERLHEQVAVNYFTSYDM